MLFYVLYCWSDLEMNVVEMQMLNELHINSYMYIYVLLVYIASH
jgi:hypothetical protein